MKNYTNKRTIKRKSIFFTLLILCLSVLIAVPSFAYAYFHYYGENFNPSVTHEIGGEGSKKHIDDIEANYTGIKEEEKEYEIYFFPSVLYTQYYYNQLSGKNYLNLVSPETDIKPEDWFGYNEIDENGEYNYVYRDTFVSLPLDPMDTSKGDLKYINYINDNYDSLRSSTDPNEREKLLATYVQYTNDVDLPSQENRRGQDDYHYTYEYATRDFGDPSDYTLPIYYQYRYSGHGSYGINGSFNFSTEEGFKVHGDTFLSKENGQFNYDNIYRLDRFGYWQENRVNFANGNSFNYRNTSVGDEKNYVLTTRFEGNDSYNLGRYLPLKINVKGAFPIDLYESVIHFPSSDMGDRERVTNGGTEISDSWYNFSFAGRGYFKDGQYSIETTNGNYLEDSFTSFDTQGLFDIMRNLEDYVTEVVDGKNIIRLFPIFSNGTGENNYASTGDYSGFRDSYKLNFDYIPDSEVPDVDVKNLGYFAGINPPSDSEILSRMQNEEGTGPIIGNENEYGKYLTDQRNRAVSDPDVLGYMNDNFFFYDDKDAEDEDIPIETARMLNFNFDKTYYQNKYIHLQSAEIIYGNDADWGMWYPTLDANNHLTLWNGDQSSNGVFLYGEGLYNVYVFSYNTTSGKSDTFEGNPIDQNNYADYVDSKLVDLYPGKEINLVEGIDENLSSDVITHTTMSGKTFFVVGLERVYDIRFLKGDNTYEESSSMLKEGTNTSNVYLVEDSVSKDNFGTNLENDHEEEHNVINDFDDHKIINNIDDPSLREYPVSKINNEQYYVIKNVDFRNALSKNDIEARFTLDLGTFMNPPFASYIHKPEVYVDEDKGEFSDLVTDSIVYRKDNIDDVFISYGYYFKYDAASNSFIPLHDSYLGVYDFILYFTSDANSGERLHLYAFRHYNIQLSIYSEDATHEEGKFFAQVDPTKLIWQRKTFVGDVATPQENGVYYKTGVSPYGATLEEAMADYFNGETNQKYRIRDHVTGLTIFMVTIDEYGNVTTEVFVSEFVIRKHYVLYIEKMPGN